MLVLVLVDASETGRSRMREPGVDPLVGFKRAFGHACPMRWLETSGAAFPPHIDLEVEYLPDLDMTECDLNMDAAIWSAQGPGGGQITTGPFFGTIGKEIERAVTAAVAAAESQLPAFKVGFSDPNANKWAKTLQCRPGVGTHQCMFGERENTSMTVTADDVDAGGLAKAFWNSYMSSARASAETKWVGSDPGTQFRAVVSRGWISYRMTPYTSCVKGASGESARACRTARMIFPGLGSPMKKRVFASVHVRMGDACDILLEKPRPYVGHIWGTLRSDGTHDRPCISPSGYEAPLRRMKDLYGVTDVLLATDSPEAVEWAKRYSELPVHYFDWDRTHLGGTKGGAWVEHRETDKSEVEGALLGLELLSYGHVLIGNMCSWYTNAIFDAMNGRKNTIVPYISVDGCAIHSHASIPSLVHV